MAGVGGGQELAADEDRVGAGEEAQRLQSRGSCGRGRRRAAPPTWGRPAAPPRWCARTPARRAARLSPSGVPGDRHQGVDRQAVGVGGQGGQRVQQAGAIAPASRPCRRCRRSRRAMPASRTRGERVEAVLVGAGGDDARRSSPGRCRGCGCSSRGRRPSARRPGAAEHAQRGAGLHAERLHRRRSWRKPSAGRGPSASRQAAPMQNRCGAAGLGARRFGRPPPRHPSAWRRRRRSRSAADWLQ